MGVIIIAEGGVNHNGSLECAKEMVKKAAEAGVDYIKFQTFKAEKLVSASAKKAEYQKANCGDNEDSQLAMLRALELSDADFAVLADECRKYGLGFMSTPFDLESIDTLAEMNMDYWKIPSGEITNLPYLRKIASKGGKVILSTGMSTLDEVEAAVNVLADSGISRECISLLHCTTQYPTPFEAVNLRAMNTLRELDCHSVGYSDHTLGYTVPVAAVALGAEIIEKHFTLDKTMPGPDHKASLSPDELNEMVKAIRITEKCLGSEQKLVTDVERPNIVVARKSIVASRHISKGETLTEECLTTKRPATGLSPMLWDTVVGSVATRDYEPDECIESV